MATRLGRWCIPVGKWKKTCRPHSKGLLADADNSFWSKPPINVDGHIVTFSEKENKPDKPDKPEKRKHHTEEELSWIHRLLASYHG